MNTLNAELGKYLFSVLLEVASQADKEVILSHYLTFLDMQTIAEDSSLDEEIHKKIKKRKKIDWINNLSSQYQFLNEELNGKNLTYDKIVCKESMFGSFKMQECDLSFYIGEGEHQVQANIDAQLLLLDNQYRISNFHQYIKKTISTFEKNTIKQELAPYADMLSKNKPLQQGYHEYLTMFAKQFNIDDPEENTKPKSSDEDILAVEQRIQMTLPTELKSFYQNYSNGSYNEWLYIYPTREIVGVIDYLKENGTTENIKNIEELQHLNDELMVFSATGEQSNLDIFMFDKQGNVYGYNYWDDGFGNTLDNLPRLHAHQNFAEKMNEYINTLKLDMIYSEDYNKNVPDSEQRYINDVFNPTFTY